LEETSSVTGGLIYGVLELRVCARIGRDRFDSGEGGSLGIVGARRVGEAEGAQSGCSDRCKEAGAAA
jgi:hypothetical protein